MPRPTFEVATIFRQHGQAYRRTHSVPLPQRRVMRAIEVCRTAALGGHVEECSHCSHTRIAYNSCRNRHCPKCQGAERAQWVERRKQDLLPVPYFHIVFTLPAELAPLALQNKALVYGILFRAAAQTLLTIAADPKHLGAEIGFFAILHTWGQNLLHHPHLHCVVPGGGLSPDGQRWMACRPGFFLPVRVLSRLFRRLFLEALDKAFHKRQLSFSGSLETLSAPQRWSAYLAPLRQQEWVVYAQPPFGGPDAVLAYLGRYTHRVALSNDRILAVEDDAVTFQWKDYRRKGREKSRRMTVSADEFIRRFLLHTLPPGFQRIRHFGWLANRHRRAKLEHCRQLLAHPVEELLPSRTQCQQLRDSLRGRTPVRCPACGKGEMRRVGTLPAYRWPGRPPDTS